jgi:uncharacterized repeat protein (TIGR03803 family)
MSRTAEDCPLASSHCISTNILRGCSATALLFALALLTPYAVQAQTFTVLHTFSGLDGLTPYSGVTLDRAGNLYGTTYAGGPFGLGTVYQLKLHNSSYIHYQLHAFTGGADGAGPYGGVVFGPDGQLYGTTVGGDTGAVVFSLRPQMTICRTVSCPWTETVLYSLASSGSGAYFGEVTFDLSGNLYGTTAFGGADSGGTVFQVSRSGGGWVGTEIYTFLGAYIPAHGVIVDSAGNLYGTTIFGGQFNAGLVFELEPNGSGWTEQDLASLGGPGTGGSPETGLIRDSAGNFYGGETGNNSNASVFELSPSGQLSVLYIWSYSGSQDQGPVGNLVLDHDGNLYGTTYSLGAFGYGNIFKLTRNGNSWTYADLYDFQNNGDGAYPTGDLSIDSAGNVYGTTSGDQSGHGTVWKLTP